MLALSPLPALSAPSQFARFVPGNGITAARKCFHFLLASGFWSKEPEELQEFLLPLRLTFQTGLAAEGSGSISHELLPTASPRSGLALAGPDPGRGRGRHGGSQQTAIAACSEAPGSAPLPPPRRRGHRGQAGRAPAGPAAGDPRPSGRSWARGEAPPARARPTSQRGGGGQPWPREVTATGLREALAGTCPLRGPRWRQRPRPGLSPALVLLPVRDLLSASPLASLQHTPHPRPPLPIPSTTRLLVLCNPTFLQGKVKGPLTSGRSPGSHYPSPAALSNDTLKSA